MATQTVTARAFAPARPHLGFGAVWAMAAAMLRARQGRRILSEMDARLLADIGTSRADAQTEAARPFWDIAAR